MTDPRQGVVFGTHADRQRAAAELGAERGVQTARCCGDLEAALSHQRLRLGAAAVLGERQLRFGVDRVRQLDEVGAAALHRVLDVIQHAGLGPSSQYLTAGERGLSCRSVTGPPDPDCARADGGRSSSPTSPGSPNTTSRSFWGRDGHRRSPRWANRPPCCRWPSLPGFTPPTAAGHSGHVLSVGVGAHRVLVLAGRMHAYEGHDLQHVVHPVRTACAAGARVVVLTNAAGAVREDFTVGQSVLISDHLNLTARSPLIGAQFVDMVDAYAPRLRTLAREIDPALADGCTPGCPDRTTRRPPRSGCCGCWAPTWSACRPCTRRSRPGRRALRCWSLAGDESGRGDHRRAAEPRRGAGHRRGVGDPDGRAAGRRRRPALEGAMTPEEWIAHDPDPVTAAELAGAIRPNWPRGSPGR